MFMKVWTWLETPNQHQHPYMILFFGASWIPPRKMEDIFIGSLGGEGEEQGQSLPKFEFLFKVDFFELYHDIKNILIYKMNCNLKLP